MDLEGGFKKKIILYFTMPVSSFEFLNTLIEPENDEQQQAEASLISIVLKPIRIAKQKKTSVNL